MTEQDNTAVHTPPPATPANSPKPKGSRAPRKHGKYTLLREDAFKALPNRHDDTVKSKLLSDLQKNGEDGVTYVVLKEVARVKVQATTRVKLKTA